MAEQTFSLTFQGYWREENKAGIPEGSGVYCVYTCTLKQDNTVTIHKLIYIGEGGNVRKRIAEHPKADWDVWRGHLNRGEELCFSFARVEAQNRVRVQAALIFRHKPPENSDYKWDFPFDKTTINASEKTALLVTSFTVDKTT